MDLGKINEIFDSIKESEFVQNFIEELTNKVKNPLEDNKLITKFRDELLIKRNEILQEYAKNTESEGQMYYIYNKDGNSYDLTVCEEGKSHEVITKKEEELPEGVQIGSVLRKKDEDLSLDKNATATIANQISDLVSMKMKEQDEYLQSKRIDGHIYEVGEKSNGKVWLYDEQNVEGGGVEALEEPNFPKDLYKNAKEGDKYIYTSGQYKEIKE